MNIDMNRLVLFLIVMIGIAGCRSTVPLDIREPPGGADPSLEQVQQNVAGFRGTTVRWGGKIVKVDNQPQSTVLEVIGRPLDDEGRPQDEEDTTAGRFLVRSQGFLDPAIYRADRSITVSGVLDGVQDGKIGERAYAYAVVNASRVYLWKLEPKVRYISDPWFPGPYYYDPYWYPWGPRYRFRQGYWW